MIDKLVARAGPLRGRTVHFPPARRLLGPGWLIAYRNLGILGAFSALSAVLVWPIFGPDYPPGVDTATFLHLSWVTKLAASGDLSNPFSDPYWYGGFPYLEAYPPLGYGLVGVLSFITRIDLVAVYTVMLVLSHGGLGAATYWFALEMGVKRWSALLAGVLAALAYPVLSAVFLWGWFTSILALPLALAGLLLLERSLRTGNWKPAAWGGLCMATSILTHHMTGLSVGLGMAGWFGYHAVTGVYPRRQVLTLSALFVGVTALVVLPWGVPFVLHILDAGFRREVPGLWMPGISAFRNNLMDTGLIGAYVYPSYIGTTFMVLAIGGTVYALLERRRLAGLAVALLVLTWFSLGASYNPLIKVYPFSGLDAARFHLFMVPFMAVLSVALVERTAGLIADLWPSLSRPVRHLPIVALLVAVLALPVKDVWDAQGFMGPYKVRGSAEEAIRWLALQRDTPEADQGPVYSIGLWTWHSFLIPYLGNLPLVDGWHDEGASNVEQIRELRLMGWTGNIDIERTHGILSELGAGYVLVNRAPDYPAERSQAFWDGFEAHPEWFEKREQWGGDGCVRRAEAAVQAMTLLLGTIGARLQGIVFEGDDGPRA